MTRKREDSADGCRLLASDDQQRAQAMGNPRMRATLERSAAAWEARAKLLDRLEANFLARAHDNSNPASDGASLIGSDANLR